MKQPIYILLSQQGAMFGLDARIALAIFGGLSVVTGAALFNVSLDTQNSALRTEINNITQAYMSMNLDTGLNDANFDDIIRIPSGPNAQYWKGPYLTRADNNNSLFGGQYAMLKGDTATNNTPPQACNLDENCFVWLSLTDLPEKVAAFLDKSIDSTQDPSSGLLRYFETDSTAKRGTIYYAFLPSK